MAAQGRIQRLSFVGIVGGLPASTTIYTVSANANLYLDYFYLIPSVAFTGVARATLILDGAASGIATADLVDSGIILQLSKPLLVTATIAVGFTGAAYSGALYYGLGGDEV
jgi:hypothetical protein